MRKDREYSEMAEMDRQEDLGGGHESQRHHRATRNGKWLRAIPHYLTSK